MILQKSLGYLINPFKGRDQNLWQVLTFLANQEIALVDQGNSNEVVLLNEELRFELPGVLTTGTDVYPVWKQVRLPLDASNNVIGALKITRLDINAKVPDGTGLSLDILITKDKGITFNSVLGPDPTQKLILPAGLNWIKFGGDYLVTGGNILQDGWWFRIDILAANGASGVELVIRGSLII